MQSASNRFSGQKHGDQGNNSENRRNFGPRQSLNGRGRWMDNVFIERLWRSLKYECVFLNAFKIGTEARHGVGRWIGSAFAGRTPDEVYATQEDEEKLAA